MLPIDKVCAGRPAQTIFFSARATLVMAMKATRAPKRRDCMTTPHPGDNGGDDDPTPGSGDEAPPTPTDEPPPMPIQDPPSTPTAPPLTVA